MIDYKKCKMGESNFADFAMGIEKADLKKHLLDEVIFNLYRKLIQKDEINLADLVKIKK